MVVAWCGGASSWYPFLFFSLPEGFVVRFLTKLYLLLFGSLAFVKPFQVDEELHFFVPIVLDDWISYVHFFFFPSTSIVFSVYRIYTIWNSRNVGKQYIPSHLIVFQVFWECVADIERFGVCFRIVYVNCMIFCETFFGRKK